MDSLVAAADRRLFLCGLTLLCAGGCSGQQMPTAPTPASDASVPVISALLPRLPGPTARLKITINSFGDKQAIKDLSIVRFDLTESLGNDLKFRLDHGDGAISTEPVSLHLYKEAGLYSVEATVTDRRGRQNTTRAKLLVISLISGYINTWLEAATGDHARRLDFDKHDGREVEGSYFDASVYPRIGLRVRGVLSGERTLHLWVQDGREFVGPVILNDLDLGPNGYQTDRRLEFAVFRGAENGRPKLFKWYEMY